MDVRCLSFPLICHLSSVNVKPRMQKKKKKINKALLVATTAEEVASLVSIPFLIICVQIIYRQTQKQKTIIKTTQEERKKEKDANIFTTWSIGHLKQSARHFGKWTYLHTQLAGAWKQTMGVETPKLKVAVEEHKNVLLVEENVSLHCLNSKALTWRALVNTCSEGVSTSMCTVML